MTKRGRAILSMGSSAVLWELQRLHSSLRDCNPAAPLNPRNFNKKKSKMSWPEGLMWFSPCNICSLSPPTASASSPDEDAAQCIHLFCSQVLNKAGDPNLICAKQARCSFPYARGQVLSISHLCRCCCLKELGLKCECTTQG